MMYRLDLLLVKRELSPSREKAREFIKSGCVKVNGNPILKPSHKTEETAYIDIKPLYPFVGRGGVKLNYLLEKKIVSFKDLEVLDIGASTGGFTEVILKDGAKAVTALDVGKNQLADKLKLDPRVTVRENTDIRDAVFNHGFDAATVDVSFISIKKVLPRVVELIDDGFICVLFKPQFEAGKLRKKHGIFNDISLHKNLLLEYEHFVKGLGMGIKFISPSPIRGGSGNIEYISVLVFGDFSINTSDVADKAFQNLVDGRLKC